MKTIFVAFTNETCIELVRSGQTYWISIGGDDPDYVGEDLAHGLATVLVLSKLMDCENLRDVLALADALQKPSRF